VHAPADIRTQGARFETRQDKPNRRGKRQAPSGKQKLWRRSGLAHWRKMARKSQVLQNAYRISPAATHAFERPPQRSS